MYERIHCPVRSVRNALAQAKTMLSEKVDELFPEVHIVISDLKSFLSGTFHSVSHRDTLENIYKLWYFASIANYVNFGCRTDCYKPPLVM